MMGVFQLVGSAYGTRSEVMHCTFKEFCDCCLKVDSLAFDDYVLVLMQELDGELVFSRHGLMTVEHFIALYRSEEFENV